MPPKEAKRRQYGTGSIYQRQSDGRWMGVMQVGWTKTGGRRTVSVSSKLAGPAGKADVKRKMDKRRREVESAGLSEASPRTTVKAWAMQWLENQESRLRPATFTGYRTAVGVALVTIGHRKLTELEPNDIRSVTKAVRDAGNNSTTARLTQIIVAKMLRDAVQEGYLVPARVFTVEAPAKAVNDRSEISIEDVARMLAAARQLPDGSRWTAAFLQGLRQGEALGLTWECVDLKRGVLDVSWQLQSLPYDETGSSFRIPDGYEYRQLHGALCLVRPKTSKGQRIMPIAPGLVEDLAARPRVHSLVWPAWRNGSNRKAGWYPQTKHGDIAASRALQDAAGVRHPTRRDKKGQPAYYVIHEDRHTTATLLMALGVDESVRTAILGHSSMAVTRGYQHASVEMAREALTKLAGDLATRVGQIEP